MASKGLHKGTRDSGLGREAISAEDASVSVESSRPSPESRCPESRWSNLPNATPEHDRQITNAPGRNAHKRTRVGASMERRLFTIGLIATLGACVPGRPRIDGAPAAPPAPSALWPVPKAAKEPPPPAT